MAGQNGGGRIESCDVLIYSPASETALCPEAPPYIEC